ncbi:RNA polymerase sigma factor [Leptospira semungkisensis]|uniref:RNA polymerase sigma factor n=1 Tax=Leptospira semungkisensis TaxID=2484985 RepID=A0A4R9FSN7_9LEPT|nr:RNA polymerase sigma factor [Leptospira semungkisensis]TGK01651.1 RNA polymerase sigma factor [Leptospira semungkisensis]
MTESELAFAIESSKQTVLRSIQRHIASDMASLVEDLAQDTYLRYYLTFRNRPLLEIGELNRWLYVAARNECRRAIRKWNREGKAYSRLKAEIIVLGRKDDWELPNENLDEDKRKWLELHINLLPSPYKETMMLRLAGEKLESIAQKLEISEGTVKSRISRGKEWLSRFTNSNRKDQGGKK